MDPRSLVRDFYGWFMGFFSFWASGPPPDRLEQLLALEEAGEAHPQLVNVRSQGDEDDAALRLDAMRVHGGYGFSREYDVERYFRDAPLMILGEGTNEVQRNVIAAQLVARDRNREGI